MPENTAKPKKYFSFRNFFILLINLVINSLVTNKTKNTERPKFCALVKSRDVYQTFAEGKIHYYVNFYIKKDVFDEFVKNKTNYKRRMEIIKSNLLIDLSIKPQYPNNISKLIFEKLEIMIKNKIICYLKDFVIGASNHPDDEMGSDRVSCIRAIEAAVKKINFSLDQRKKKRPLEGDSLIAFSVLSKKQRNGFSLDIPKSRPKVLRENTAHLKQDSEISKHVEQYEEEHNLGMQEAKQESYDEDRASTSTRYSDCSGAQAVFSENDVDLMKDESYATVNSVAF